MKKKFAKQFASYIAAGVGADDIEQMYAAAHKAIRADPEHKKTEKKKTRETKKMGKKEIQPSSKKG